MADRGARAGRPLATRGAGPAVVDVLVLVLAIAVALVPLVPVFGVRAVIPAVVGGLALGTGLAVVGAVRTWHAVTVTAAVVVVYLGFGGALAAPSTTVARVVPTWSTVTALAAGAATSWKQVLTLQPPLGTSGTLLAAPYLLALVGAVVVTTVTLRARRPVLGAFAAIVPALCLVAAVVLGTRQTIWPVASGVGLAVGLATWAAWRSGALQPRRVLALGTMAAVAVAGGMIGGPVVIGDTPRYVVREEIVPPFDPRAYPSPLSAFRQLVKADDAVVMTVTGLPVGARVRLATFDEFDGVVWNVAGDGSTGGTGEFRRVGETIESMVTGTRAQVDIEIGELSGVWLPTVGQPTAVRFADPSVEGDLRFNDATGGAVLTRGVSSGLRYTLDVIVPDVPDDETIGGAGAAAVNVGSATGVPDAVGAVATEVARNAGTPVQIARSLQKALAEGGFYSNGLIETGSYPSFSGHGADRLTTLLGSDLMVGDAEQYASAMALMARQMDLPSRVVLGFVPTEEERDGDTVTVTAGDVDAWVEIAFSGVGWVPFDPTPPRTQTPQEDSMSTPTDPQPQVVQPPPAPPEPVTPPEDDTEQPQTEEAAPPTSEGALWQRVVLVAGAVSVPLVVVALPFLVVVALKVRRRRRRRRGSDVVVRVASGWDEVLDTARDLRVDAPALATRRESAASLVHAFAAGTGRDAVGARAPSDAATAASIRATVTGLADEADAVVFGPGVPSDAEAADYWRRVDAAVGAMRGTVPWLRRVRSRVSLASLRDHRSPRPRRRRASGRPLPNGSPPRGASPARGGSPAGPRAAARPPTSAGPPAPHSPPTATRPAAELAKEAPTP